jgi:GNAT superfamily N-acetyltransferase
MVAAPNIAAPKIAAPAVADGGIRPLGADDVEAVIAIDRGHSGRARRRFFEKRFAAARTHAEDFVHLGASAGGALRAFAVARILRGEFGHADAVAVLDAIGVEHGWRERGLGRALLEQIRTALRGAGVRSLTSQADWTNHDLVRFFGAAGFTLAPRLALERSVGEPLHEPAEEESSAGAIEINYGGPAAPDFGPLARDRIPVRSIAEPDLRALVAIDRRITGRDRGAYFDRKLAEALHESDVRVSLVAERDGGTVGFIMARVDLGGFGRVEPTAVLDTIGVDPDYRGLGVGRALLSQLLVNLTTLRVEDFRTEIDWRDRELLGFLDHCGFRPSRQLCFEQAIEPQPVASAGERASGASRRR